MTKTAGAGITTKRSCRPWREWGADEAEEERLDEVAHRGDASARDDSKHHEQEGARAEADQHLHAHPVGQSQITWIARQSQPPLGGFGRGSAAESPARPRQPRDERAQGPLCERLLQLELFEVAGLDVPQLSQSGLDRVD